MLLLERVSETDNQVIRIHSGVSPGHNLAGAQPPSQPGHGMSSAQISKCEHLERSKTALANLIKNSDTKIGWKRFGQIAAIIICLALLSAVALPCFIGSYDKYLTSVVKGNMRTVQIAAESYAADNHAYPESLAQLMPYLPGGAHTAAGKQGSVPCNPISVNDTGVVDGPGFVSSASVAAMRARPAGKSLLHPGQVAYCNINNGKSYAVIGANSDSNEVAGIGGKVLVLSCL